MTYFGRVYKVDVTLNSGVVRTFGGIPQPGDIYQPYQVQFVVDQTPNAGRAVAEITLYGIGRESRKAIYDEGATVVLTAGWRDNYAVIFSGSIANVSVGRAGENTTLKLFCNSITTSWQQATVSRTFGNMTPQIDIIRDVAETFGYPVEFIGDFASLQPATLGRTIDRGSVSAMNQLAQSFGFTWFITNGRTIIVRDGAARPNIPPIEYTTANGIIGSPEITDLGVNLSVLLNPAVQPWDTYTVQSVASAISVNGVYYQRRAFPRTTGESVNQVVSLRHEGDFYGDTWQTYLEGSRFVPV